jgi:hypothetical protein
MSDNQIAVRALALQQRINRVLARHGLMLKKTPMRETQDLKNRGDYFVFDVRRNLIAETHIDLEDYARKLGVLRSHEFLERATDDAPRTGDDLEPGGGREMR